MIVGPKYQEAVKDPLSAGEFRAALFATISGVRLATYMAVTGHDQSRALRLYIWNAQVGEAFHLPIQSLEVALRNRVNLALVNVYGAEWWRGMKFLAIADEERRDDLLVVKKRIENRRQDLSTGQVVAGLSFGFWVGMLQPKYNPPIWGSQLRVAFPDLPVGRSRKSLAKSVSHIANLRNRIWHHEPIVKRNLSEDFSIVMTTLEWVCPTKAAWIRPHCRIPELLRAKP